METPPESVIVFGSFARSEAVGDSDIDVVVVRPDLIDEDDDEWATALEAWRDEARAITGNPVEVVEVSLREASSTVRGRTEFWRNIRRDGVSVYGLSLATGGAKAVALAPLGAHEWSACSQPVAEEPGVLGTVPSKLSISLAATARQVEHRTI